MDIRLKLKQKLMRKELLRIGIEAIPGYLGPMGGVYENGHPKHGYNQVLFKFQNIDKVRKVIIRPTKDPEDAIDKAIGNLFADFIVKGFKIE